MDRDAPRSWWLRLLHRVLIMTLELFPLLFPHVTYMILLPCRKTTHFKDNDAEVQQKAVSFALCLEFIRHQCWFGVFPSICSSSISHPGQWWSRNTEKAEYRGPFIEEDSSCWAGEGAEVNYSITRRLSQELFKQAKASRGLGLITPAKVTPTTLSNRLLQCVSQTFGGIFISMEEGSI